MFGAFNVLGFIYNWRKAFLGLGVLALLWGLALGVRHYYYIWHVEPFKIVTKKANRLSRELNSTKELLEECRNKKRVEVFTSTNRTMFDAYRREIEEMESEKRELNSSSSFDNYEWMYH